MEGKINLDSQPLLADHGDKPFVTNIERATTENQNYRLAFWTGKYLQMTLMSLKVGESIGLEMHPALDQFIRIEKGSGLVRMGAARDDMPIRQVVSDADGFFIPAGTWHNLINVGLEPLKLYSIYASPQHPFGTVQKTKPKEY